MSGDLEEYSKFFEYHDNDMKQIEKDVKAITHRNKRRKKNDGSKSKKITAKTKSNKHSNIDNKYGMTEQEKNKYMADMGEFMNPDGRNKIIIDSTSPISWKTVNKKMGKKNKKKRRKKRNKSKNKRRRKRRNRTKRKK